MNQEQVIYLLNAIILAMVGVIIIQQAKKKEAKKTTPIRRKISPVVIQFDHYFYPDHPAQLKLTRADKDWQERREVCSKITNHLFQEFMKKDSQFIEISNSSNGFVSGKIYILPINEQ